MDYTDRVVQSLRESLKDPEATDRGKVHELRVAIKRLRSLWRLLRRAAGEGIYHEENSALRALAREYSAQRDRDIVAKRIQRLRQGAKQKSLRQELARLEAEAKATPVARPSTWSNTLKRIEASAQRLQRVSVEDSQLRKEWRRSRKVLHKQFLKCRHRPSDPETFHRWRRRSKNLLYQNEFLAAQGLRRVKAEIQRLRRLCEDQGKARDFQILGEFLRGRSASPAAQTLVLNRRRKMEKKSLRQGKRLIIH